MNNLIKFLLLIFPLFFLTINAIYKTDAYYQPLIFPAEFEKQDSIWIAWSDEKYRAGKNTGNVVIKIISELEPYIKINLLVRDTSEINIIKDRFKIINLNDSKINYHVIPQYNRWIRDSGPIFVKSKDEKLKIIDFKFNFYGLIDKEDPYSIAIKTQHEKIADKLEMEIINTELFSEGGNREFNGKGTMLAVKTVEMARNPDKTLKEIEEEFKILFGVKKVIWLRRGLVTDDSYYNGPIKDNIYSSTITDGHIDEFCRFVSADTILLAEVSDEDAKYDSIYKDTQKRLEDNYLILKNSTDQNGNPFKIIRIPVASNIIIDNYESSEKIIKVSSPSAEDNNNYNEPIKYIIASSYLNFLVTNSVVLMPKYWKENRPNEIKVKDETAKKILESVFPDRKIIQIDVESLNHGGGGIHCITQQQPAI